ncbi:divalent metal cation transporter, partial [Nocardia sp. NPDC046763]|uniref:divalent metal cation transporter n=1 Tax=Nocardia sp. NPDC046763 TaxID=3155256 RepID=UPI0033EB349D
MAFFANGSSRRTSTVAGPAAAGRPVADAQPTGAVMDSAHVGDIVGALGSIGRHDTLEGRTRWQKFKMLLAVIGPGLIVMVGDNDAGGVATYAQAGQNYGMALVWTLVLLIPVLYVNQEMVVRLG